MESSLLLKNHLETVNQDILLEKHESYDIHRLAGNCLRSFLKNRKQYIILHGVSSSIKTVTCSFPQGSTLSPGPKLFLSPGPIFYINDLKLFFSW